MTPGGAEWSDVAVLEDLALEVTRLSHLAERLDDEARSARHPDWRHKRDIWWQAEKVRTWADEVRVISRQGDGLDRRAGLDRALHYRQVAATTLAYWRSPLGVGDPDAPMERTPQAHHEEPGR